MLQGMLELSVAVPGMAFRSLVLRVDGSYAFPTEALVPGSLVIQTHY